MEISRKQRIAIHRHPHVVILDLGEMEIWDGTDMALLRDTMLELIEKEECRSLGVDLRTVKYIPSGFFGMLMDWHDRGVAIRLYSPQPNVQNMVWFRKFFHPISEGCYKLHGEPSDDGPPLSAQRSLIWAPDSAWCDQPATTSKNRRE